ncbi:uncharacterized protein EAE98_002441 [Botrytis deweyae]|uniref:LysM domain-containing protein n=1 Tax=Botrytis deweyae TaxID=2478750 RepID=A0ABQ7IXK2_9HELO|nr:uncharacterized protein EAE98_002441 [Botrytis deweyae]KAF7936222.1 hypothetical protein EAE98_002441 [Botrytis deweyae]
MISFLYILFYILLPDLHSILASPPQCPLSHSTITVTTTTTTTYLSITTSTTTRSRTKHPCFQHEAPASCFVTTYSTTTPFTWPAVGTPTKTRAYKPEFTPMKDLPLAPGTSGSCERYTNRLGKSDRINICFFVAHFYEVNVHDFIAWNPSLTLDAKNTSSCVLAPGYRYCLGGSTV